MYRICIASSGYYFVQKNFGLGRYNVWRKVSPFFRTRKGAKFYDAQFRQHPDLAQNLKDKGFRFVARFDNSSGSICNVFHRITGERDIRRSRARWTRVFRD